MNKIIDFTKERYYVINVETGKQVGSMFDDLSQAIDYALNLPITTTEIRVANVTY